MKKKKKETVTNEYHEYDKKELEKLRKILLEMLDEVVRICDKHHLTYFLAGGTALGAIKVMYLGMMMLMSSCQEKIMKSS